MQKGKKKFLAFFFREEKMISITKKEKSQKVGHVYEYVHARGFGRAGVFFFFSFLKYSHGCQSASFQNINTKAVFRILTKAYSCHCNFETGFLLEKVRFYIIFVLLQKRES